jgi:hypothetical protein
MTEDRSDQVCALRILAVDGAHAHTRFLGNFPHANVHPDEPNTPRAA